MRLNFDLKYLFAYNDPSKTIYNNYSIKDIIFVQEEHISYMGFHIERCEFRMIGGLIQSIPCEECSSYSKCKEDIKDIVRIKTHTAIIKNPKTNDIDIVGLNDLDFKLYSTNKVWTNVYRVWNNNNIIANTSSNDIEMSKRIDSFLEYGDSL